MTARLFTLNPVEGFRPKTFAGHRDAVVGAYFSPKSNAVSDRSVSYAVAEPLAFKDIHSEP